MQSVSTKKGHAPMLIILLGTAVLAGACAFILAGGEWALPWERSFALDIPRSAARLSDGDFIVIDKGDRRLSRIRPDGMVAWTISGESRSGGFYTCELIGVDAADRVWIVNGVMGEDGNLERDEFVAVQPDGRLAPPLYARAYAEDESVDYPRQIYYPRLGAGGIYFLVNDAAGVTTLNVAPFDGRPARKLADIEGFDAYEETQSALVLADDEVLFLRYDGTVARWRDGSIAEAFEFSGPQAGRALAPTDLVLGPSGSVLALDNKHRILAWDEAAGLRVVLDPAPELGDFYVPSLDSNPRGDLALIDQARSQLWSLDAATGALSRGPASLRIEDAKLLRAWGQWLLTLAGAGFLLWALGYTYVRVFERRTPLLVKQLLLFLPLVVCAVVGIAMIVFQNLSGRLTAEIETRLTSWGYLGSRFIDPADVAALHPERDGLAKTIENPAFARLEEALAKGVNGNADAWNSAVYDYIYILRGDQLYVFDQYGYFERYIPREGMRETLDEGRARIVRYRDAYSGWYSSFTPVLDAGGQALAIYEVAVDLNILEETRRSYGRDLVISVAVVAMVLAAAFGLFTLLFLRSIRKLNHGAKQLAVGNYDEEVEIRSRDEIEDLGRAFNQMAREIKVNIATVTSLNEANTKFVPSQFLLSLGRKSILDVNLGDQVERNMAIFFSDIRNFTDMSERMTPEENFRFLNEYLSRMGPKIREAGGFIDKYIGDSIMALFPQGPADAVRAALGLFANLDAFPGLAIGVGIHSGRLMLGVIGESERFDGTVISDAVNLSSRLESLTKYYGVYAIISGSALAEIEDRSFFRARLIDRVKVKGKDLVTELHEVYPEEDPGSDLKAATAADFAEAFADYSAGRMEDARKCFEDIARRNPHDAPALLHARRCQTYAARGLPPDWDGTTKFNEK